MSWFVQVIVSPTRTVDVPGTNVKFLIVTPADAAALTVAARRAFGWLVAGWRRCFGGTSAGAVVVSVLAVTAPWPWPVDVPTTSVIEPVVVGGSVTSRSSFASEV